MMKSTFIALALAALGSAHALIIDDFTTGPYSVSLVTPAAMDTAFQAASVPGGTRTTRLAVEANPLMTPISLVVGGGFAISDSGTMADSWVRLGYGYENNGSGVPVVDPMNLNLSSMDRFRINFLSNDLNNDVKVYVGTLVGTTLNVSTSTMVAPGGNASTPFSLDVMFSSFTGSGSFSDADVIVFEFDNSPSGDFALSSLEAVPEPATIAVIGAGLAALARRRRKA